jgi:rfaE bifunctional protein nucleotidyltransferase chain/domain
MTAAAKIMTLPEVLEALSPLRDKGGRVAFANGLFDLLHVGHLRYLQAARLEGDVLVVGINSDGSARELKGPDRPMVPENERAELIAGFSCVDHVVIFDELTVEPLLRALRPDVHCKGTDYTAATVPERGIATELGIRIAIVGDPKDHATRDMIGRIRGSE